MFQIQNLTSDANQVQTVILPDGTSMIFTMYYSLTQAGWFFNLTHGTFILNGVRITVLPNILYQFKNQLTFGLGCFPTTAQREPTQQQDFSSKLFNLFILSQAEVNNYTLFLEGRAALI